MLTTVQNVAAEHLAASAARPAVAQRHAMYFGGLVEAADWPREQQTDWGNRLRSEAENLRIAVRWFFDNDISPLPHIFRVLWLFWQMHDRMPEGRAWIHELRSRMDELDDRARAEVLFTMAVTAVEVGDDRSALAAVDAITPLIDTVDDPALANSLQLAIAWARPIVGDFEGALAAASIALDGFRRQDEPFVAFAALTVGMLEMTFGRPQDAGELLREVDEVADRLGNIWLTRRLERNLQHSRCGPEISTRRQRSCSIRSTSWSSANSARWLRHSHWLPSPSSRSHGQIRPAQRSPSVPPAGCGSGRACSRGLWRAAGGRSCRSVRRQWMTRLSRPPSQRAPRCTTTARSNSSAIARDSVAGLHPSTSISSVSMTVVADRRQGRGPDPSPCR